MEYALTFYIVSVLDNVRYFLQSGSYVFTFAAMISLYLWILNSTSYNKKYRELYESLKETDDVSKVDDSMPKNLIKNKKSAKVCFIVFFIFAIISELMMAAVPTKKDAVRIIAGVGVVEAMKSDTVKTLASKSVQVIESWLDEQLAEAKKNGAEAAGEVVSEAKEAGKQAVKEAGKKVVEQAVK